MKNQIITLNMILLFLVSCSIKKNDVIENFKRFRNEEFNIVDTVALSGFIIFNEEGLSQFFQTEKLQITDTLKYVTKRKKTKGDYFFVQPFEAKKYNIYTDYCSCSELDSQLFTGRLKCKKEIAYMYCNEEEFIVLKNRTGIKYLSFKCWKPYVKKSIVD